jgi:hypothetical protein
MAFSGALVYKSVDQTALNASSVTAMTWNSEQYDVGGWHDTGSNTSRLTVPSGVTHVKLTARLSATLVTDGVDFYCWIAQNGNVVAGSRTINMPFAVFMGAGAPHITLASGPLAVTPGDYFELYIVTGSAGGGDTSITITGGATDGSWFAIEAIESFSGAIVKKAADQATANYSAAPVVTWDTDVLDVGGWHDTGSNTSRLTVPSGVSYVRVAAGVSVNNLTAANDVTIWVEKDGDNVAATRHVNLPVAIVDTSTITSAHLCLVSGPIPVVAGAYFELRLSIPGDSSVTFEDYNWFSIEKLA